MTYLPAPYESAQQDDLSAALGAGVGTGVTAGGGGGRGRCAWLPLGNAGDVPVPPVGVRNPGTPLPGAGAAGFGR